MLTENELLKRWLLNRNAISGRYYRGLTNQEVLSSQWFNKPERITFYQAKQNGLRVKKWAQWVRIKYEEFKEIEDNGIKKTIPFIKYHYVFNLDQTEKVE